MLNSITQARLKELLHYDAATGVFTRRVTAGIAYTGDIAGSLNNRGYRTIQVDYKTYQAHRLAWLYVYGEFPDGNLDHIDQDKQNNCIDNLRIATPQENRRNSRRMSNNKTGITGVRKSETFRYWDAGISTGQGKWVRLYHGPDFFEACCRRKAAEIAHGYHPNHGKQ